MVLCRMGILKFDCICISKDKHWFLEKSYIHMLKMLKVYNTVPSENSFS